jgi:hypothetical protein
LILFIKIDWFIWQKGKGVILLVNQMTHKIIMQRNKILKQNIKSK